MNPSPPPDDNAAAGAAPELHPEYAALLFEVAVLEDDLADLLIEHDQLVFHTCPQIEAEYTLRIGIHEIEILETETRILRAKRKIELVQQRLNRGEEAASPAVLAQIETQLDTEYARYAEVLAARQESVAAAREIADRSVLTPEDGDELRQLYRQIVKTTHPDVAQTDDPRFLRYFEMASAAYAKGKLDDLRALALLVKKRLGTGGDGTGDGVGADADDLPDNAGSLDELRRQRDALREQKARVSEKIAQIKETFPFNLHDALNDDEWVAGQIAKLTLRLETLKDALAKLEARLRELTGLETAEGTGEEAE